MIEIIKAFDPVTMLEINVHRNQRVIKKTSLPLIRKKLEFKHSIKQVLFIIKELNKETEEWHGGTENTEIYDLWFQIEDLNFEI